VAGLEGAVAAVPCSQIIRVMPVTKITLSTAMRARDVSRPRAEQLAEAAGHGDGDGAVEPGEAAVAGPAQAPARDARQPDTRPFDTRQAGVRPAAEPEPPAQRPGTTEPGPTPMPPPARRRRRRGR
jgi:hypothetical protein